MRILILASAFLVLVSGCAYAEIEESRAVRAIIGEAANQGYNGMLAVACGIRNRGTLNGVYGYKAKWVDKEPSWVWEQARRAWRESAEHDITNGADHWHNLKREGETYWTVKMDKVYEYKDHVFYKERSK